MPHERSGPGAPPGIDPAFYALSKLRRRRFDEAVGQCTALLRENNRDQAVWYIKTRALTLSNWVDDTDLEEEGVAEMLLDDNAMASAPRPGTSLSRPQQSSGGGNQVGGTSRCARYRPLGGRCPGLRGPLRGRGDAPRTASKRRWRAVAGRGLGRHAP